MTQILGRASLAALGLLVLAACGGSTATAASRGSAGAPTSPLASDATGGVNTPTATGGTGGSSRDATGGVNTLSATGGTDGSSGEGGAVPCAGSAAADTSGAGGNEPNAGTPGIGGRGGTGAEISGTGGNEPSAGTAGSVAGGSAGAGGNAPSTGTSSIAGRGGAGGSAGAGGVAGYPPDPCRGRPDDCSELATSECNTAPLCAWQNEGCHPVPGSPATCLFLSTAECNKQPGCVPWDRVGQPAGLVCGVDVAPLGESICLAESVPGCNGGPALGFISSEMTCTARCGDGDYPIYGCTHETECAYYCYGSPDDTVVDYCVPVDDYFGFCGD